MVLLNGVTVTCSVFVALICSATLLAFLAAIAGTGGGSLFLPLFSVPLSDVHFAVPLSKTAVLGTAIGACCVNYVDRKSTGDLINYRLVTLIQPATLLGCTCGVLLNLYFPSPVITSLMLLILGFTAYKTFQSAAKLDEHRAANHSDATPQIDPKESDLSNLAFDSATDTEPLIKAAPYNYDVILRNSDGDVGSIESLVPFLSAISGVVSPRMQISTQVSSASPSSTPRQTDSLLNCEAYAERFTEKSFLLQPSGFLLEEVVMMAGCWAINLICLAFAGSPAALVCGTWDQRAWIIFGACFLLGFIWYTYLRLSKSNASGHNCLHGAPSPWLTPKMALIYIGLSYLAGVGAALLGIGGGLIKSPLLIAIGLQPISAVATYARKKIDSSVRRSNFMILFTATTNVIIYSIAGRLNLADSFYFTPITFLGGVVGVIYLRRFFANRGTQSQLTRILGSTIILGALVMIASSVLNQYIRGISDERTMTQACITLHRKEPLWSRIKSSLGL